MKKKIYLSNEEFIKGLNEYRDKKNRKTKNEVGRMFILLVEHLLRKPCFVNYSPDLKDDMRSDALYTMLIYSDKYDPSYALNNNKPENPFSYFTQIAFNAFIQNIKKYHKLTDMSVPLEYVDILSESSVNCYKEYLQKDEKQTDEEIEEIQSRLEKFLNDE